MSLTIGEVRDLVYKAAVRVYKHGGIIHNHPRVYFIDEQNILPRLVYAEVVSIAPYTVARLTLGDKSAAPAYGISKCSPLDKFDPNIGQSIAITRAVRKWLTTPSILRMSEEQPASKAREEEQLVSPANLVRDIKGWRIKNSWVKPGDDYDRLFGPVDEVQQ